MTFEISFPRAATLEQRTRTARLLLERLTETHGVSATFASPGIYENGGWSTALTAVDGTKLSGNSDREVQLLGVGPGFFETLGIRVRAGRALDVRDDRSRAPVAVVNETFAQRYFNGASAIGHVVVRPGPKPIATEIVGVVGDVKHMGIKASVWPVMYLSALQGDGLEGTLFVRALSSPASVERLVRSELKQADPSAALEHSTTLESTVSSMISRERLVAYLAAAFGALASLLAAVGLYGVMAYNVSRRAKEIGIRMALGARPGHIRWLAMQEALGLTITGLIVGIPAALGGAGLVRGLLYRVNPRDTSVLICATALVLVVAVLAGWIPAARASRADPNVALRQG
jgi:predicted permease